MLEADPQVGLLLVTMLLILLRVADLHPQNVVQEPVNGLVPVEHKDELHNDAQVQRLEHLPNETQLGELQDHPVFRGLLECKVLHGAQVVGLGYDVIFQLHVLDAFGLCIHHEEAVIKVLFGRPPDSLLGVPKGLSEAGEDRVEVGRRGDASRSPEWISVGNKALIVSVTSEVYCGSVSAISTTMTESSSSCGLSSEMSECSASVR